MKINKTISGLQSVREKLERIKNLNNDEIVMAIAEKGKDIAQDRFGASVTVETESLGSGKAIISAKGSQVSFIEFGTGLQGEGTYQGELPTQDITFIARNGKEHTTDGWVYNYFVKDIDKNAKDHKGFVALAPMWRTANDLRNGSATQAVLELLDGKGV